MSPVANVTIHRSQFPGNVRRDLLESLRHRRVNHKFHYDSVKQAQQWLALHQAYSPSRNDPDCAAAYGRAFEAAMRHLKSREIHVVGLGCGGGQKDTRLLARLKSAGRKVSYTPCDVSVPLVLAARESALAVISEPDCFPLVCDLGTATDLPEVLDKLEGRRAPRLLTFFGMIPNFEPSAILPGLAAAVRREDFLLFSANLAPGRDYASGLSAILPQYDNPLTRRWLMTFLLDLGVDSEDGKLRFAIEDDPAGNGLKRVAADFDFLRARTVQVDEERFDFRPPDSIRLFFSYRHTPDRVGPLLSRHGLQLLGQWIAASGEEGVFLCGR